MKDEFGSLINNYDKLEMIFGNNFLIKSEYNLLKVDDFLEANYALGNYCYGNTINKLLWARDIDTIHDIYIEYLKNIDLNQTINIDFSQIGLLLVRPECFYYKDIFKKFLIENHFDIVLEKKIIIDFKKYLLLYYDSFILLDTLYDFPSRTFNYIDNDCYLFVVTSKYKTNIASNLHGIKGKQGKYEINTLRGDVAYNLLKNNVKNGNLIHEANIPLDPIGAGRMLINNLIPNDGSHNIADIPILFYTGQAVHVPNENEIKRDLVTLCSEQEVEYILRKVRKNNE